jgi:glycosyltransferase involved in cell wall biosynthesis
VSGEYDGRFRFSVISLYAPPSDRNPSEYFHSKDVHFDMLDMGSFIDFKILLPLVNILRTSRPDILHCHLVRANIYGRIAAKIAGVGRVVNTHHGIEDYMLSDRYLDRAVRAFERLSDGMVSCHVGVSNVMRESAIKYLSLPSSKVITIHNGIDLSLYDVSRAEQMLIRRELGLNSESIIVGSVGILNKTKNHKLLLHAASLLNRSNLNVQFVIFGEGEERVELERIIEELGLSSSVFLPGFSSNIPRMLRALDIFALTSRSEGFGLAVAEAMATGLPCVTFNVGALSELIVDGESGLLVEVYDANSFAKALDSLINSVELRESIGMRARERVKQNFSLDLMIRRYGDLYDRLV